MKAEPSLEPSRRKVVGSRSGPSFADLRDIPMTSVNPTEGVTVKPVSDMSKLRYLVSALSMALVTPSDPGLLSELAMMVSPGCVTSPGS